MQLKVYIRSVKRLPVSSALLLMILFFMLPSRTLPSTLYTFANYIASSIGIGIYCSIAYSIMQKKYKPTIYMILLLSYFITQLVMTIINNGNVQSDLASLLKVVPVCFLVEKSIHTAQNRYQILTCIRLWVTSLFIINILIQFLFPGGISISNGVPQYLLGSFADSYIMCITCCSIITVCKIINGKKSFNEEIGIILIQVICAYVLVTDDIEATMLIAVGVMLCFYTFCNIIFRCYRIFCIRNMILVLIAIEAILVFLQLQQSLPAISNFITNTLHKDVTLTGRTLLWTDILNSVRDRPWTGYGTSWGGSYVWGFMSNNAHNELMQVLIWGGLPTAILYVAVTLGGCISLQKYRMHPLAIALSFCIISFETLFVALNYQNSMMISFFVVLTVVANVKWYIEKEKQKSECYICECL